MPEAGHNSGVAAGQLRAMVERVERLEEEKAKGAVAAFVGKDGTRMSIAPGKGGE